MEFQFLLPTILKFDTADDGDEEDNVCQKYESEGKHSAMRGRVNTNTHNFEGFP